MGDESLPEGLKDHLKDSGVWLRLLYMLLFAVIYSVAEVVLLAVVVLQFLFVLFGGSRNGRLLSLGGQLSTFIYQLLRYLTYNSDAKPYPFGEWPAAEARPAAEATEAPAEPAAAKRPARRRTPKPAAGKDEKMAEDRVASSAAGQEAEKDK